MTTTLATGRPPAPSRFTFGTMSLGWNTAQMAAQMALVHQAMDLGVWFHTSQEYAGGGAFQVLRRAFDQRPGRRPRVIAKVRCDDAALLRFDVEDILRRLDLERIDVAQLCKAKHDRREIVDDLLADGSCSAACRDLHERGLVGAFSLELFASCSADGARAITHGLFDLYSFYWNPLERELAAGAHAALRSSPAKVLALRTICGGLNTPDDVAARGQRPHLAPLVPRFRAVWPLVEAAGCHDVLELSLRYLAARKQVLTTIGGTADVAHLAHYAQAAVAAAPLPESLATTIDGLHDGWAP